MSLPTSSEDNVATLSQIDFFQWAKSSFLRMPTGLNEHTVRCPPKRTIKLIFHHLPKHYKKGCGSWLSCTERCFLSLSFLDMLTPSEDLGKNFSTELRPGKLFGSFSCLPKIIKALSAVGLQAKHLKYKRYTAASPF